MKQPYNLVPTAHQCKALKACGFPQTETYFVWVLLIGGDGLQEHWNCLPRHEVEPIQNEAGPYEEVLAAPTLAEITIPRNIVVVRNIKDKFFQANLKTMSVEFNHPIFFYSSELLARMAIWIEVNGKFEFLKTLPCTSPIFSKIHKVSVFGCEGEYEIMFADYWDGFEWRYTVCNNQKNHIIGNVAESFIHSLTAKPKENKDE